MKGNPPRARHASEVPFDHYYSENPASELRVVSVELVLKNGLRMGFQSPSGVFAFGKVDRAAKVLVENARIRGKELLDLGCGFGMVGLALKKQNPSLQLSMSDVNQRAVRFAKVNAQQYNLVARIRQGDGFAPWTGEEFDMILCNPPMAAGKRVWMEWISQAPGFLRAGGSLQVVAFHNKGGESACRHMERVFGNVQTLVKSGGIRVYCSRKGVFSDEEE